MHRFVKGEPNWVEPLNQNFEEAAAHAAGRDNPHGVTAEQLGAPTKAYVDAQLSNKADVEGPVWHDLPLLNGATSKFPVQYCRIHNLVVLQGWVSSPGAMGNTVFCLPEGFRPPNDVNFLLPVSSPSLQIVNYARLIIYPNGNGCYNRTSNEVAYLDAGAALCCSFVTDL